MEVLYIDILVGGGFALAPQQQALLGGHLFNGNILNGKSQDDRPDHTEGHFQIAIDNFFSTNRYQVDTLGGNEVQCFVDIGNFVETHFTAIGLGQSLTRDHFKQQHQFQAIAEIVLNIIDTRTGFTQMTVAPCCKCLKDRMKIIKLQHDL